MVSQTLSRKATIVLFDLQVLCLTFSSLLYTSSHILCYTYFDVQLIQLAAQLAVTIATVLQISPLPEFRICRSDATVDPSLRGCDSV